MKPMLAIVGPTGIGKSRVSQKIAQKMGGEIISLDSRAVYRYLDVGTDKPSIEKRACIRHHLIDVVDPDFEFTAAHYVENATSAIKKIKDRGRPVIFAGGTGWYLKALTQGLDPLPASEPEIRKKLERDLEEHGVKYLHEKLKQVDSKRAERIHPHDSYRIIRALEVFQLTGHSTSDLLAARSDSKKLDNKLFTVVLYCERSRLKRQIAKRCEQMLSEGLIDEVKGLMDRGYNQSNRSMRSVGYQEVMAYLEGQLTRSDLSEEICKNTALLAKRQMTWWRSVGRVTWVYCSKDIDDTISRIMALSRCEEEIKC